MYYDKTASWLRMLSAGSWSFDDVCYLPEVEVGTNKCNNMTAGRN